MWHNEHTHLLMAMENLLLTATNNCATMDDLDKYVQAFSKKELLYWYEITNKTWYSWMEEIEEEVGKEKGKRFKPKQVEIIFSRFGVPPKWKHHVNNQKKSA